MSRFFRFVLLASPLCLSGCGLTPRGQSAFFHPVGAPARAVGGNRSERQAPEFDSLSRSLGALNGTTLDALLKRWQKPLAQAGSSSSDRAAFLPSLSVAPALVPAQFSASAPLVFPGHSGDYGFSSTFPATPGFETPSGAAPIEFILPRTVRAVPVLVPSNSKDTPDVSAFLKGWAARQSLARADEELLERRALNERIALLSHAPLPGVDLSLVAPEVQLELTNLRLELLPLLSVPPAQKARARARIDAIEARLRQIWEAETARQAQVRRHALEEVPARLAREGETALEQSTRRQARLDQQGRAQVAATLANGRPSTPSLSVRQSGTIAPDAAQARALLQTPFAIPSSPSNVAPAPLSSDTAPLSRSSAVRSASVSRLAQQQERAWREAIR